MAATKPAEVGEFEIANPFRLRAPDLQINSVGEIKYVEDRIRVIRTLRDDALARLHHRRHITPAMFRAGRHWQRLYAEAAIGRIGSSGDIQEPVDGSKRIADMITDRQQHAMKQLARLSRALGIEGESFIMDLLASNLSYTRIARRRSLSEEYVGRRIRECLDTLAKQLGYCT